MVKIFHKRTFIAFICTGFFGPLACGGSYNVSNQSQWNSAVASINSSGASSNTITITTSSIQLNTAGPLFYPTTIVGSTPLVTISGTGGSSPSTNSPFAFFAPNGGTYTLSGLALSGLKSIGGSGAVGVMYAGCGGGGLGAGGAIYIDVGVTVILENCSIDGSSAVGGAGGSPPALESNFYVGGGGGGISAAGAHAAAGILSSSSPTSDEDATFAGMIFYPGNIPSGGTNISRNANDQWVYSSSPRTYYTGNSYNLLSSNTGSGGGGGGASKGLPWNSASYGTHLSGGGANGQWESEPPYYGSSGGCFGGGGG